MSNENAFWSQQFVRLGGHPLGENRQSFLQFLEWMKDKRIQYFA